MKVGETSDMRAGGWSWGDSFWAYVLSLVCCKAVEKQ